MELLEQQIYMYMHKPLQHTSSLKTIRNGVTKFLVADLQHAS
jgi:hypothetical protein